MVNKKNAIKMAMEEAYKSEHKNFKHGAVLVDGKKIISKGYNRPIRENGRYASSCKSIHAEMDTINEARHIYGRDMKNCIIYVIRINCKGKLALSKPCMHCTRMINKYNIRQVVYSTNDTNFFF